MPVVSKQTTKPQAKRTGSILDRIAPVSQVDSGGLKVSLYGRGKTGKTRLISTFPKKCLIIGAEDGTRSIRNVTGVDFVRLVLRDGWLPPGNKYIYLDEYDALMKEVKTSYQTFAVDTASALQDLILADILGLTEVPTQKSWGMATRDQYGQRSLRVKTMLRVALELPGHVIITAHEANLIDDDSGSGSDLMLFPSVGSALSKSTTGWLNGAVEYLCQTFIREKSENLKTSIGGKEVNVKQKTGGAEYCLRIGPHPVFQTGFRLPPGFTLPDVIVNPDYSKINKIINGQS